MTQNQSNPIKWHAGILSSDIFFVLSRSMPLKTLTCTMTHTHNGIGEEFVRAAESKIFCRYL